MNLESIKSKIKEISKSAYIHVDDDKVEIYIPFKKRTKLSNLYSIIFKIEELKNTYFTLSDWNSKSNIDISKDGYYELNIEFIKYKTKLYDYKYKKSSYISSDFGNVGPILVTPNSFGKHVTDSFGVVNMKLLEKAYLNDVIMKMYPGSGSFSETGKFIYWITKDLTKIYVLKYAYGGIESSIIVRYSIVIEKKINNLKDVKNYILFEIEEFKKIPIFEIKGEEKEEKIITKITKKASRDVWMSGYKIKISEQEISQIETGLENMSVNQRIELDFEFVEGYDKINYIYFKVFKSDNKEYLGLISICKISYNDNINFYLIFFDESSDDYEYVFKIKNIESISKIKQNEIRDILSI